MISPKAQLSLQNAREYFRQHLAVNDYYSEKNSVAGEWLGEGSKRLNLEGKVSEEAFLALCDGNDPETGQRLTQRRNSLRRKEGAQVANRRLYYDFTISPPKSVSILALMRDKRVVGAHERAVRVVMEELEKFAETRVRIGQKDGSRPTRNLVAACFRHDTSRELDPHVHSHCIVFNATFDPVESRWKALQTHGMLKAQRFASGVYDHELCRELHRMGYQTRAKGRNYEVDGIPEKLIKRFSKRSRQIDEETAERLGKMGPDTNIPQVRDYVARKKRRRKIKDATAERLHSSWLEQLEPAERAALDAVRPTAPQRLRDTGDLTGLLTWGAKHVFDRKSVVPEHELMVAALMRGRGQDFDFRSLRDTLKRMPMILGVEGDRVTSRELVELESKLVSLARRTVRTEGGLNLNFQPAATLSDEQQRAVKKILESRSFMTLIRGAAGTGKSSTLREVKRGLEEVGRPVVVLAPQRQQALDLEYDGLPARTLAGFLEAGKVPEGAAIILDEASQVGIRDLDRLTTMAHSAGARLILSGDTRQHGAVAASDALILLERYAGLPVAKLRAIRRQDPRLAKTNEGKREVAAYRSAVKLAARGKAVAAFDKLDALGWIIERRPEHGRETLAVSYISAIEKNERALVVAQTWAEVDAVNEVIRSKLRDRGRLGASVPLKAYRAIDLTPAQKEDPGSYCQGAKVLFLKSYGRYRRGDLGNVVDVSGRGLAILKDGRRSLFGYRYADRLAVLEERTLEIAPGDRLQLKWNGESMGGLPIVNGELVTVREIHPDGRIAVGTDRGQQRVLGPEQRLFNLGYAVTSYASQGKTVDTVLFSDAGSRLATNMKQWFVTISRARRRVLVYTPDKAALRKAIAAEGHRPLAIEAFRPGGSRIGYPQRIDTERMWLAAEVAAGAGQKV